MIQRGQQRFGPFVVKATLNADRATADGGQRLLRGQRLTNTRLKVKALKPCGGQNNGVVFAAIKLAQTRANVAAQRADREIRPRGGQLTLTA